MVIFFRNKLLTVTFVLKQTIPLNLKVVDYLLVDGDWGNWQAWSECSATCGQGERTRQRDCDNPHPQYNGQACRGDWVELNTCDNRPCPGKV